MTRRDVADALAQYRAGLQTGIELLRQLDHVSRRQQAGSESRDFQQLAAESDARQRITNALVSIEPGCAISGRSSPPFPTTSSSSSRTTTR